MADILFTAEEVAERLQLNRVTVQRWIRDGRLEAINLGGRAGYRVRGEDVEALLYQEYGNLQAVWFRVAQAIGQAVAGTSEYAAEQAPEAAHQILGQLDDWKGAQRSALLKSESYKDVKGFYRPRAYQPSPQIPATSPEAVSALATKAVGADAARMFEPFLDRSQLSPSDVTGSPLFHVVARGLGMTLCGLHMPLERALPSDLRGATWCAECMRRGPSYVVAYFTELGVHYVQLDSRYPGV